jgi:hypothetical protein
MARCGFIDLAVVNDYWDVILADGRFPPVLVFDDGKTKRLVDGLHRIRAVEKEGIEAIECEIHSGDRRAAILAACQANATHGLRRTNAQKRAVVGRLLNDSKWTLWSDHEIARRCNVSAAFVGQERERLTINVDSERAIRGPIARVQTAGNNVVQYRTKHGVITTMQTGNIGRAGESKASTQARIVDAPVFFDEDRMRQWESLTREVFAAAKQQPEWWARAWRFMQELAKAPSVN